MSKAYILNRNEYKDYFTIKQTLNKGNGVFALKDIPPNIRIPYDGKKINEAQFSELEDRKYVMSAGRKGEYIDANPSYPDSAEWIAGLINEPSQNEIGNMRLIFSKGMPMIVSVRNISKGEELLFNYGSSYKRNYKVGRSAPKPKWW